MIKKEMLAVSGNLINQSLDVKNKIIKNKLSLLLLILLSLFCTLLFQSCDFEALNIPSEDEIIADIDIDEDTSKNTDQSDNNSSSDKTSEINQQDKFDKHVFLKMDTSKIESSINYIEESMELKYSEWTMVDLDGKFTRNSSSLIIYEQGGAINAVGFSYNGNEEYCRVQPSSSQLLVLDSTYKGFILKIKNDILYLYNDIGTFRFKEI